jgi:hypothetical protein
MDAQAIRDWLLTRGWVVAGGGLLREYAGKNGNRAFVRLFNQLLAAGRAVKWRDELIDKRAVKLRNDNQLRSDDHDIIALAQLSRARALWSRDRELRKDFTNKELLDRPRGKLYLPEGNVKRRMAGIRAISSVCCDP